MGPVDEPARAWARAPPLGIFRSRSTVRLSALDLLAPRCFEDAGPRVGVDCANEDIDRPGARPLREPSRKISRVLGETSDHLSVRLGLGELCDSSAAFALLADDVRVGRGRLSSHRSRRFLDRQQMDESKASSRNSLLRSQPPLCFFRLTSPNETKA